MERTQQKKNARKNLRKKDRHDRFISAYVKAKHPQIYMEAEEFYEQIDKHNPGKRDLCKTVEFLQITTRFKTFTEYYKRKKSGLNSKRKNQPVDNMVLNIPLLKHKKVTEEVNASEPNGSEPNASEPPLAIPDHLYQDLLQEIRNDPDLYAILNDMDIPEVENIAEFVNIPEDENQQLWTDQDLCDILSSVDEQTPLEKELLTLGY